jgi:hypothetical protein
MVRPPRRRGGASLVVGLRRDRLRCLRNTASPGLCWNRGGCFSCLRKRQVRLPGLRSRSACGAGRLFWPVEADWHCPAARGRAPLQRPTQAPIVTRSGRQDDDRPWPQSAALIQRAAAHRNQANGPQFASRFGWPICGAKSLRPALQEIRIVTRNNAGYDLNRLTLRGRAFRATAMHSRILVLTHPRRETTLRANNKSSSTSGTVPFWEEDHVQKRHARRRARRIASKFP